MKQMVGNFWITKADYRCIPVSGALTPEGAAILDSTIAKQAADRFANLDGDLGRMVAATGSHVYVIRPGVLSFPVKRYLWSALDLEIIKRSGRELAQIVGESKTLLPMPDFGAAGPTAEQIVEALSFLPDNVTLLTPG